MLFVLQKVICLLPFCIAAGNLLFVIRTAAPQYKPILYLVRVRYKRMPIEAESPEERGYGNIRFNLAESSVSDALLGNLQPDLRKLLLAYGDHRGLPELRGLLAAEAGIAPENVLITAGAASALFIAHTALLEKGDRVVVMHPNYATNIETPQAIGCKVTLHKLRLEKNFQPDLDLLAKQVVKGTKLISITTPNNPGGSVLSEKTILAIARIAEKKKCMVLVDETYRELTLNDRPVPKPVAALHPCIIGVSSVSKAYGVPGIRIGWIQCRDSELMETFLAAKEQMYICNSVVDETIALRVLKQKKVLLKKIRAHVQANYEMVFTDWVNRHRYMPLQVALPEGGVVCFPRIIDPQVNIERFYDVLYNKYGTMVGPGHWFGMNDAYFRLGFGWPKKKELEQGLENIIKALKAARV